MAGPCRPPLIPLSDGAGEVVAVGPGDSRVRPGDRVAGIFMQHWIEGPPDDAKAASAMGGAIDGMLAEKVCLSADGPGAFSRTSLLRRGRDSALRRRNGLERAVPVRRAEAGGNRAGAGDGRRLDFALQFAKMAGARVIATSGSEAKLERLRLMAADDVINYKTTPEWDKPVRAMTGGTGVDHVVEVGGAGTLPLSVKAVRRGGHIALIGVLAGRGEFDPRPLLLKSIRLQGIFVGSREMFEEMNRAIGLAGLRPVVDRVFGFEEVLDAMRYMESGAHFGKVCIKVS